MSYGRTEIQLDKGNRRRAGNDSSGLCCYKLLNLVGVGRDSDLGGPVLVSIFPAGVRQQVFDSIFKKPNMVDQEPAIDEFMVIDFVEVTAKNIILNVRLRTNNEWKYYRRLELPKYGSIVFRDFQEMDTKEASFFLVSESVSHDLKKKLAERFFKEGDDDNDQENV